VPVRGLPLSEKRMVIDGIPDGKDVVPQCTIPFEDFGEHLLPIDEVAHRLADPYIAERCLVDPHRERSLALATARRDDDIVAARYDRFDATIGE
jgi:hypothetical protein